MRPPRLSQGRASAQRRRQQSRQRTVDMPVWSAPCPLLMPQQYVRSATPIVHPGLLEMRCCRARSTAAGSVRRWEPPAKAVIVPRRGVRKILTLPLDFRYVSEIRLRFGDFKAILRQSPGRAWIEKILIFFLDQLGGSRRSEWRCGAAWPAFPDPARPGAKYQGADGRASDRDPNSLRMD